MPRRSTGRSAATAAAVLSVAIGLTTVAGCSGSTPDVPTTTEHDMTKMSPSATMAP